MGGALTYPIASASTTNRRAGLVAAHTDKLSSFQIDLFPALCDCLCYSDAKALRGASHATKSIVRVTPENCWRLRWEVEFESTALSRFSSQNGFEVPGGIVTNERGLVIDIDLCRKGLRGTWLRVVSLYRLL